MSPHPRRRRRRLIPEVRPLEPRLLLTARVTCLGQVGVDLVGPNAAQGSDGIQDLDLHLSNLSGTVASIEVQAPDGFAWATEPDPTGAALAEYFPSTTAGQGDVYINPQVQSDLPPPGGTLPLGGSTGALIDLSNGMVLTVTITYDGSTTPDVVTVPVSNLISPTDPMAATPVPADVQQTFGVTDLGQDGTGQSYGSGLDHLVVTAPAGTTFSASTFGQIVWTLTDDYGNEWDSTDGTIGHDHIFAALRAGSTTVADLYFPPLVDEAPASGSSAATMLLQVALPGNSQVYATPFAGTDDNLALLTRPFDDVPAPAPPTTEAQLRADLVSSSPEYDTIDLPAGQTIVVTQPLEITHSIDIIGNGATLYFDQGNTAAWPASAPGAIYVSDPGGTNIQVTLSGFTITFDQSQPLRWSNPAGTTPALFDPEDNPDGVTRAVIDTRDANSNENRDLITLTGVTVEGPPAFDGSSDSALQAELAASGDTIHVYAGEQAIDLLEANDEDSGTITGCTFQGGPIDVYGGPWTITDNTVLGAMPDTYSPDAFGLHAPFDSVVEGNVVSQSDAGGEEYRLVVMAIAGHDDTIEDNTFGGGAGWVGDELTYDAETGQFIGINAPEVILAESTYGVQFEGRPAAVSGDGRLLVLTGLRASAAAELTGPGMVVSILAGVGADGSPDMTLAGQWYPVAQQVSLSGGTIELLMQVPLPPAPSGGYYEIEVTGGFVDNTIQGNTLDLAGKASTDISLEGEDFGTTIRANEFLGASIYDDGYNGMAILLGGVIDSAATTGVAFPMPWGWTALPNLGTVIEDNTIEDSLGGIEIGVNHAVNYWTSTVTTASEEGRVFVSATVVDNTFEWDAAALQAWSAEYVAQGNEPGEVSTPPTITVGGGWSSEAPSPYANPRFPWTVGNAMTLFGSDVPIFVDPTENVVTIEGNITEILQAGGTVAVQPDTSGQVYDGIINGVTLDPPLPTQTYNGEPYWPFNLDNLNIYGPTGSPTPTSSPSPTPTPSPSPTPTPSPSPSPTPTPTPTSNPPTSTAPSPAPTPTPTSSIPAPTGLNGIAVGTSQVDLGWNPSNGATGYIVERSTSGGSWSVIATDVQATDYTDTGLSAGTLYQYAVIALTAAGDSVSSVAASVVTASDPASVSTTAAGAGTASAAAVPAADSLAGQPMVVSATQRQSFSGVVAAFTDANVLALASSFVAMIHWGDGHVSRGRVTGSDGQFEVIGVHRYAQSGHYSVKVTIKLSASSHVSTTADSVAAVARPLKVVEKTPAIRRSRHT